MDIYCVKFPNPRHFHLAIKKDTDLLEAAVLHLSLCGTCEDWDSLRQARVCHVYMVLPICRTADVQESDSKKETPHHDKASTKGQAGIRNR